MVIKMNKPVVILCIIALLLNTYFLILSPAEVEIEFTGGDDEKKKGPASSLNVTVPPLNHNDQAKYSNEVVGEMYWINYTSGNWTKITLSIIGTLINEVMDEKDNEDGFGIIHQTIPQSEHIAGTVTISYKEGNIHNPDEEGEDVTINGNADISRIDHTDLNEKRIIKSKTTGEISIDRTLQQFIPLAYKGSLRSYPDPNKEVERTLDDIIYGEQNPVALNDTGTIEKALFDEDTQGSFYNTVYHWAADKTEVIAGYDALRININATFGSTGFHLPFYRQIWISNEVSKPVKLFTRTNQSYADEDGQFYFFIENTQELSDFKRGKKEIEWGSCSASSHYDELHYLGEYLPWKYLPQAGEKFADSSFSFNPNEAVSIAMSESSELKSFIDRSDDDVIVEFAQYNSTSDPTELTLEASHRWLLLFTHKLNPSEWEYYRENDIMPKERYAVQVTYNESRSGFTDKKEVENDYGLLNWSGQMSEEDLAEEMLSLATAEEILKSDKEIKSTICTNPLEPNKIYWNDPLGKTQIFLGQGISQETTPSIGVIETLTGFTIPTSKISWIVQKGQLMSQSESGQGTSFAAAVDAETGRLQYVLDIEGTSLFGLFG